MKPIFSMKVQSTVLRHISLFYGESLNIIIWFTHWVSTTVNSITRKKMKEIKIYIPLLQFHPETQLSLHTHDLYCPSSGTHFDPVAKEKKNILQVTHKTQMQDLILKWLECQLQVRFQDGLCPTWLIFSTQYQSLHHNWVKSMFEPLNTVK